MGAKVGVIVAELSGGGVVKQIKTRDGMHQGKEALASLLFNEEFDRLIKGGWRFVQSSGQTVRFRKGGALVELTYKGG